MTDSPPPMQVDYEPPQPRPSNALGIASLVCGCLLCIPLLPGLAAVILGIFGIRQSRGGHSTGKGLSIAGLILGCLNIVGWLAYFGLIAAVMFPSLSRARETANRVKCASQMRSLGQAMLLYANENRGVFPPNLEALILTQDITGEIFICPSSTHTPAPGASVLEVAENLSAGPHLSYVYLGDGLTVRTDAEAIVMYELLSNHGGDGINVLYADGHVEFHSAQEAARIVSALESGQNPPPREPLRFGD